MKPAGFLPSAGSQRRMAGRIKSHGADRWFHPRFEALEHRCLLSMTPSVVVERFVFYDNSKYDGNVAGISASDDLAIASDKSAYIAGTGAATFSSVTSFTRGINGIMVDLAGTHGALTASDFIFKTGNNNSPSTWTVFAGTTTVTTRAGAGTAGSDRIQLMWADNTFQKTWLEVIVKGNDALGGSNTNTGLAASDVFFFGNALADDGTNPDDVSTFRTTATDELDARANPKSLLNNIPLTNIYDYNRDGRVDATDQLASRANPTSNLNAPKRINIAGPPALSAALANDTAPGGGTNSDGITQDPTIVGTLTSTVTITSFLAGLNAGPVTTDLLPLVQVGGGFTISPSLLDSMNGGPLPDGPHTVHLRADDSNGATSFFDVTFTLKRSIAAPQAPDLTAGSDTGTSSVDDITNDNTPTIEVTAEAGSIVTLYVDGLPGPQQSANPTAQFTLSLLGDGNHTFQATAVDGAGNVSVLSGVLTVTIDTIAPAVTVSTLISFGDDRTPHVTVTGSGLPNNTQARLDVDVNNDGDFTDTDETSRTLATLYNSSAYFQVTPALPATDPIDGPYLVQLRARASDVAGNEGTSPLSSLLIDTLGSNALANYVNAADATYSVSATPVSTIAGAGYTVYVFDLKSQTWRSAADVTTPLWQHWLQIIVPTTVSHSTALLLVSGGSIGGSAPTTLNDERIILGTIAAQRQMITVILPTVPNQPLHFTDEPAGFNRSEDDIIAYTFNKFVNNIGQPGNETWPALLPMVKSAVKAMDAVQAKDTTLPGGVNINNFIVTGYSKRGWTTWLTGAVDSRVTAVIPGVIDLLNLDESMVHHYGFYGFFAQAIQDYQDFNLIENILQPANQEVLGRIVDPYRYLENSNLTNIPKLLLNSTGDEFFVPDSSQFYFSDIPGPKYLRYIPNTGHSLDTRAVDSTQTFTNALLNNLTLPQYSWTTDPDGALRVQTPSAPTSVLLWQATNPSARDFRRSINPGINWTSSVLTDQGGGVYVGNVATPATGARAFMIELTFASPIVGNPYVFTTDVRVVSNLPLVAWPFFMPTNGAMLAAEPLIASANASPAFLSSEDQNHLVFGLALPAGTTDPAMSTRSAMTSAPPSAPIDDSSWNDAIETLFDDWSWIEDDSDDDRGDDSPDVETIDFVLADLTDELAWSS